MKKIGLLVIVSLLLTACGEEAEELSVTPEKEIEKTEDSVPEKKEVVKEEMEYTLSAENLEEVIEYNGTGEGDQLVSAEIIGEEVRAVIQLAANDLLPTEELAYTRYSQVSDELLMYEGWKVLSVEYEELGEISMNRSETETNEWGMTYFPSEIIRSKLN